MASDPLHRLKPGRKTAEFWTTSFTFVFAVGSLPWLKSWVAWYFLISGLIVSYMIVRGLTKRNRPNLLYSGWKTTEFYAYATGLVAILVTLFFQRADFACAMAAIIIIQMGLNLSRGITKTFTLQQRSGMF